MNNDADTDAPRRRFRLARFLGRAMTKLVVQAVIFVVTIIVTVYLVRAFDSRSMPDLYSWHTRPPVGEFRAEDFASGFTFEDYLATEQSLFDQLDEYLVPATTEPPTLAFSRFVPGDAVNPDSFEYDWNRTTILEQENPVGGALLLHGLTDSPYSMRSIAEVLHEQGYYTVNLRVPGHGIAPAGLTNIRAEDWLAATKLAAQHVSEVIGPDRPLVVFGYSNGGALATAYAIDALEDPALPKPAKVYLFSPAIGITPFAVVSTWHKALSWSDYFEKFRWQGIELEFDPFKFNSFPKNAGAQIWRLTRMLQRRLARLERMDDFDELPPITTFQSVVDSTVLARAVVTRLYDKLPENGSELVVFDVNRMGLVEQLLGGQHNTMVRELEARQTRAFSMTIVANRSSQTREVEARTYAPGTEEPVRRELDLMWPEFVFSLSHLAVPFPPDDPLYGQESADSHFGGPTLGSLSLRGERRVLLIPADQMLRQRFNPFHSFLLDRIRETLPGAPSVETSSAD